MAIKTLDLYNLWQVCNILSEKQEELSENSVYISFLGTRSSYTAIDFQSFLEYYSFKTDNNTITIKMWAALKSFLTLLLIL